LASQAGIMAFNAYFIILVIASRTGGIAGTIDKELSTFAR